MAAVLLLNNANFQPKSFRSFTFITQAGSQLKRMNILIASKGISFQPSHRRLLDRLLHSFELRSLFTSTEVVESLLILYSCAVNFLSRLNRLTGEKGTPSSTSVIGQRQGDAFGVILGFVFDRKMQHLRSSRGQLPRSVWRNDR